MLNKQDLDNIRTIVYEHGHMLKIELREELSEIKTELIEFKKEMYSFRDEMYAFKDEMYSFRDDMYAFKGEMYSLQAETRQKFKDIQEDIAQFKDETLGQFKDIHEDITILAGHQDIWERHEYDIKRLKKKVFPDIINDGT